MNIKMLTFKVYKKFLFRVSMNNIYKELIGEIFLRLLHHALLLEINEYLFEFKCSILWYLNHLHKLERSKTKKEVINEL